MKIEVHKSELKGEIKPPQSKSILHRILIADYFRGEKRNLSNPCDDVIKTQEGLRSISEDNNPVVDCGDSGSTLRFLIPIALNSGKKTLFKGSSSLRRRPILNFLEILKEKGCQYQYTPQKEEFLTISGELLPGQFQIPGDFSSQYTTALLMTLPTIPEDSQIFIKKPIFSRPYIDITLSILKTFGIKVMVQEEEQFVTFNIEGNQKYKAEQEIEIEGDWSAAAFFLAANEITGNNIDILGMDFDTEQGDKRILDILRNFENLDCIDIRDVPDLFPIIALLSALKKDMVIHNTDYVRGKESDRVHSILKNFNTLGIKTCKGENSIKIFKANSLKKGCVDSFFDHRIAMTMMILASTSESGITIDGVESISKSYPSFLDDFISLGGIVHVI